MPVVEVISVGSELVLGQTLDTNAHWLSARRAAMGLPVARQTTVGDEVAALTAAIQAAAGRADVVILTGGLGPTRDDLTREAIAAAAGVRLELDTAARDHIAAPFRRWGRPMPKRNEVQALIPVGGRAIANPNGTAPGIEVRVGRATLYAMPGVPREMRAMFDADIAPRLDALAGGAALLERRLHCVGVGESTIGERIHDLMDPSRRPRVSTTVAEGLITVRIVARADGADAARDAIAETETEIRRRLGDLVFGIDDDTLEGVVGTMLVERGLSLAVAESMTGGLIADRLTDVPGISASLIEAVVAYSNRSKTDRLDVPAELFEQVGAVSEAVASAMAAGIRRRAGADLALSTTGIAGPTGGSPTKPVGLVFIGLAAPDGTTVERFVCHGDRRRIKARAANAALNRLRLHLIAGA